MAHLERTFAVFLADSEWRTALPPMPRAQRATAHALAEQWGFTSASTKTEPGRYVEIFKNAKSARPSRCIRDPVAQEFTYSASELTRVLGSFVRVPCSTPRYPSVGRAGHLAGAWLCVPVICH